MLALNDCLQLLISGIASSFPFLNKMWEVKVLVTQLCPTLGDPMDYSPARHPHPWNSPGKNAGVVGSHPLLQGIFATWGWHPGLLHCRWILYHVSSLWKQTYFHALKPSAWPTLSPSVTPTVTSGFLRRIFGHEEEERQAQGVHEEAQPRGGAGGAQCPAGRRRLAGPRGRGQPRV